MTDFFTDDKDFYTTIETIRGRLISVAAVKLRDLYEAEDAVSEALMKACSKRDQLNDRDKLYSWVLRIVINHCNDILRKKLKIIHEDKDLENIADNNKDTILPLDRMVQSQEIEEIIDIMLTIEPEEQSEVLILYYYRKFSYEKISETLNIPVGTVKSRLNRARNTLKDILDNSGITREDLERINDLARWPDILILR